jgi:hypothetical protein
MIYYQDDILLTLSYLRGERTVPSTNTEGRKEFIQQTLNELYAAYRWKWNEISTYISLVSGIATLPSGLSLNHELNVSYFDGQDETEYDEINVSDKSKATQGDNVYWVTTIDGERHQLNTKEAVDTLALAYQPVAPIISATIGTPYPDRLTIALGANRFVKLSEDPDADLAQDDTLFTNRVNINIAAQNRPRPRRERRSAQSETGSYTGEI